MQLHGFKNQQQKHTLKQCFEETRVNNTPFRLAVPFVVLYTVDIWLICILRNFIFPLFLHDVSITIVKEIKFYRSFHH